jgi:hypothetical protein
LLKIQELFLTTLFILLSIIVTTAYFAETQTPIYKSTLFFKEEYTSTSAGGVAMAVPWLNYPDAALAAATAAGSAQGTNTSFTDIGTASIILVQPSALKPLPSSFEVSRQWSGDYSWSDRGVTFWTNLKKGEVIQFAYNSSEPVVMVLGYGIGEKNILWKNSPSNMGAYKVVQDGVYSFDFFILDSVHKSVTATISFKCYEAANRAAVNIPWFGENKIN